MKLKHGFIITHAEAVNALVRMGYDKAMINATIRGFFSSKGLKGAIKKGHSIKIRNLGTFSPNKKRKVLIKKKDAVLTITERFKKNKYNQSIRKKEKKETMKAKRSKGAPKELATVGAHRCRCFAIMDLGSSDPWGKGMKRQLMVQFELLELKDIKVFDEAKGPQPKAFKRYYEIKVNEDGSWRMNWEMSNAGKEVAAFMGERLTDELREEWDWAKLLGKTGNVAITHAFKQDKNKKPTTEKKEVPSFYPPTKDENDEPQKFPTTSSKLNCNKWYFCGIEEDTNFVYDPVAKKKIAEGTVLDIQDHLWDWYMKAIKDTPGFINKFGEDAEVKEMKEANEEAFEGSDEDLPF